MVVSGPPTQPLLAFYLPLCVVARDISESRVEGLRFIALFQFDMSATTAQDAGTSVSSRLMLVVAPVLLLARVTASSRPAASGLSSSLNPRLRAASTGDQWRHLVAAVFAWKLFCFWKTRALFYALAPFPVAWDSKRGIIPPGRLRLGVSSTQTVRHTSASCDIFEQE